MQKMAGFWSLAGKINIWIIQITLHGHKSLEKKNLVWTMCNIPTLDYINREVHSAMAFFRPLNRPADAGTEEKHDLCRWGWRATARPECVDHMHTLREPPNEESECWTCRCLKKVHLVFSELIRHYTRMPERLISTINRVEGITLITQKYQISAVGEGQAQLKVDFIRKAHWFTREEPERKPKVPGRTGLQMCTFSVWKSA